jgi:hypothetical protein
MPAGTPFLGGKSRLSGLRIRNTDTLGSRGFDRQSEFEKIDPIQLLDIKRDLDIGEIDFATGKESRRVSISRRNQDSNTRLARDSKPLATMYVAVFLAHIFFEREVFDPFRLECSREVRADLVIFGDLRMWVPPIPMEIADDRRK